MRLFGILAALAVSAPTFSSAFEVSRDYNLSIGEYAELEKTCLSALESSVVPVFVSFNRVQLPMPSIALGIADRVTLVTYAGVTFESDFNDVRGTLNCIFEGSSVRIWAVSVAFEERGLAGFKKHILAKTLNDPAQQRVQGYTSELPQ